MNSHKVVCHQVTKHHFDEIIDAIIDGHLEFGRRKNSVHEEAI